MMYSMLSFICLALLALSAAPVSIARPGAIVASEESLTSDGRGLLMSGGRGRGSSRSSTNTNSSAGGRKVNGKWKICVKGNKQHFGQTVSQRKHPRKPGGITVYADGRCVLDEYAGGFDGFWSTDVGDGHENDIATAARQMIDTRCRVDKGRRLHVNRFCNQFLQEMRDKADPVNLDFPEDAELAESGERQKNIDKASAACTAMITVQTDC